ncbi:MAG TPA: hypothetical protein HPP66_01515 [Planctomycetes bacterium]|nr:hypothetical protein [Planctomycetota bacterium]
MSRALQKYLDHVMLYANRKEQDAAKIRVELEDHLRQKMADLQARGLPGEDAVFQAIEDHGTARTVGYGLRKGFALLDVRTQGTARGFIAIGPRAVGIIAFGNVAVGLFAFGNFAFGALAFGFFAIAGLLSLGGISLAPLGAAVGLTAVGRGAYGMIACGGLAVGLKVPWAIDGVSFLSGENGLQFLQHFRTREGTVALIALTSWLFLIFPIMNGVMCSIKENEYKRIKKIDPKLIE